ncbi:unnamed protein product [Closterium sp. NIES-53]
MALRPSSIPHCVALPSPTTSPLPDVPDPESNLARAATPTVTRLLATVVSDPDFESTAAFALVTELVGFAARSRLDYVTSLDFLDFSTTFLQGSLHEEIWLRHPPGFSGSFPEGTQFFSASTFMFSSTQPTPLATGHSLSTPPSDESIESSGPYPELVGCLICEAEIYAGAMAAQDTLAHLPADQLGTKHIGLRCFLARELQQRGQLCLAYMASRANTADVFAKALGLGDHQRFCTALGLVPTLPHLLVA